MLRIFHPHCLRFIYGNLSGSIPALGRQKSQTATKAAGRLPCMLREPAAPGAGSPRSPGAPTGPSAAFAPKREEEGSSHVAHEGFLEFVLLPWGLQGWWPSLCFCFPKIVSSFFKAILFQIKTSKFSTVWMWFNKLLPDFPRNLTGAFLGDTRSSPSKRPFSTRKNAWLNCSQRMRGENSHPWLLNWSCRAPNHPAEAHSLSFAHCSPAVSTSPTTPQLPQFARQKLTPLFFCSCTLREGQTYFCRLLQACGLLCIPSEHNLHREEMTLAK